MIREIENRMMEVVPLTIGQNDSDWELKFDLSFRALTNQRDGFYV